MTTFAPRSLPSVAGMAAETVEVAVDDDAVRARVLATLDRGGFRVHAVSAPQNLRADAAADVIVMHCHRVASDELLLLRTLRTARDGLRIVVVCHAADGRSARRTVDAGVDGLIFADGIETVLLPTISAVLAGQTVVPARLRSSVIKPSLSFREKQILGLVALGFTNSQIGARLFLAESTVKSHLSSVFTKLGVRSRSEAAAVILDPNDSLGIGIGILRMAEQWEHGQPADGVATDEPRQRRRAVRPEDGAAPILA